MTTVYYAPNARSLRVLWALEEMGAPYDVSRVQFPPRQRMPEYLDVNPLGTIPAMVDGDETLSESMAICEYLAEKHGGDLTVAPGAPGRADYLQWCYFGEASLAQPLGTMIRNGRIEPKDAGLERVISDARDGYLLRLTALETRLADHPFLAADRFTLADISNGYALNLAGLLGLDDQLGPHTAAYWARLKARPAFGRATAHK
jgi:glutathione S-transferase